MTFDGSHQAEHLPTQCSIEQFPTNVEILEAYFVAAGPKRGFLVLETESRRLSVKPTNPVNDPQSTNTVDQVALTSAVSIFDNWR